MRSKIPTHAPRRGVLAEFLAFPIMTHKKFCNWLQKVYYPVHPYEQYVIHLHQINCTEENWEFVAEIWSHMGNWAKCSMWIFSCTLTASIDGWMWKPRHKEIDFRSSGAKIWTQVCLTLEPVLWTSTSFCCIQASQSEPLNFPDGFRGWQWAFNKGWMSEFLFVMKPESHLYAFIPTAFSPWHVLHL